MNFTTKIPISKSIQPINYDSKIVLLGSCFAENIGEKCSYFKFLNTVNPFGIIFNPVSIEKIIARAINQDEFTEKDIFFHNERWHCFEVHSDLSTFNKEELLQNLNTILKFTHQQIAESTHIIITYGTSWVYRNKVSNSIVANCHKVSQNQFEKEILPVETIKTAIQSTIDLVRKINPNCQLIFTVSPVRHIKDGFVENQQSKSHLITAIHKIVNYQSSIINYFPSYEIMMDELRDYRFYAEDMLHPNTTAINYIWKRFTETWIDENSYPIMEEINSIQKSILHKPFNANSDSHQKFVTQLQHKIKLLQAQLPDIQF